MGLAEVESKIRGNARISIARENPTKEHVQTMVVADMVEASVAADPHVDVECIVYINVLQGVPFDKRVNGNAFGGINILESVAPGHNEAFVANLTQLVEYLEIDLVLSMVDIAPVDTRQPTFGSGSGVDLEKGTMLKARTHRFTNDAVLLRIPHYGMLWTCPKINVEGGRIVGLTNEIKKHL